MATKAKFPYIVTAGTMEIYRGIDRQKAVNLYMNITVKSGVTVTLACAHITGATRVQP